MSCTTPTCCTGECRQGRDCPNRSESARGSVALLCIMLVCFAGLLAIVGPALDDHSGEAAIAQQKRDARFDKAAREMCGQNAAWVKLDQGTIQCLTHRGSKTIVAQVQP